MSFWLAATLGSGSNSITQRREEGKFMECNEQSLVKKINYTQSFDNIKKEWELLNANSCVCENW